MFIKRCLRFLKSWTAWIDPKKMKFYLGNFFKTKTINLAKLSRTKKFFIFTGFISLLFLLVLVCFIPCYFKKGAPAIVKIEDLQSAAVYASPKRIIASKSKIVLTRWKEVSFLDNPKIFRLIKDENTKNNNETARKLKLIASAQTIFEKTKIEDLPSDIVSFQALEEVKRQFFSSTIIKTWKPDLYLYKKQNSYAVLFIRGTYKTKQIEHFIEWHVYHKNITLQILFNNDSNFNEKDYKDGMDLLKFLINNLEETSPQSKIGEIAPQDKDSILSTVQDLEKQILETLNKQ